MNKSSWLTLFLTLWVVAVVANSYLLNGPQFSTWYNSDSAIHILMANDFSWPEDLYYWRQDRLGSAVPMVGYWIQLLGIPTAVAVGMAKYGFLLLGFVLASRYLKTVFAKMALAVAWFFPLPSFHFWTSLGHPYAEHLALILSAFAVMDYSFSNENTKSFGQYLAVFFTALFLMLALWLSDLTMAFAPAVLLAIGLHWNRTAFNLDLLKTPQSIVAILGLVVGGWFLMHAKRAAFRIDEYHQLFAKPQQLLDMASMLSTSLWSYLNFARANPFHSIAAWGMVLAVILVVARKRRFDSYKQAMLLVAAVCSLGAVFVSYWANTPDPALRHYTGIIPLVWVVVLMEIEGLRQGWYKLATSLAAITVVATVGSEYWFHFKHRNGEQPYQTALGIRELGRANMIGDYWHAYILAAASPDSIIGTAPAGYTVRRISQARQIVQEPEVYLIKDDWLASFPDSIVQFNRLLIKDGEPFEVAERELCNYRTAEVPVD